MHPLWRAFWVMSIAFPIVPNLLLFPIAWTFGLFHVQDVLEKSDRLSCVRRLRSTLSIILYGAVLVTAALAPLPPQGIPPACGLLVPFSLLIVLAVQSVSWCLLLRTIRGMRTPFLQYVRFSLGIWISLRTTHLVGVPALLLLCLFARQGVIIRPGAAFTSAYFAAVVLTILLALRTLRWMGLLQPLPREAVPGGHDPRLAVVRRFWSLHTYGTRFTNAFAFPFTREVAITDALFEVLTPQELRATLLHEAGHLARRSEAALRAVMILSLATVLFYLLPLATQLLAGPQHVGEETALAFVVALLLLVGLRRLPRMFEKHADAYAHSDPEGAAHLGPALAKIYAENWVPARFWVGRDKGAHPTLEHRVGEASMPDIPREHLRRARRRNVVVTLIVSLLLIGAAEVAVFWVIGERERAHQQE